MPFDAGGDSRDVLIPIAKLLSYSDSESAHIGLTIAVDRCALRENRNAINFILERTLIMKKIRKVVAMCIAIMSAVSAISLSVAAVEKKFSPYYNSPACTSDTWVSLRSSQCPQLTSSFDKPDAGNAGAYFYATGVGLSSSFVRTSSRTGEIVVYEADKYNSDDLVCTYTGYFSVRNGLYRMNQYSRTNAPNGANGKVPVIEDQPGVELYLKYKINKIDGDLSQNIPYRLFEYRLWVE